MSGGVVAAGKGRVLTHDPTAVSCTRRYHDTNDVYYKLLALATFCLAIKKLCYGLAPGGGGRGAGSMPHVP